MTRLEVLGQIDSCTEGSIICHYRCCDQGKPSDDNFDPEGSILIHPGELQELGTDRSKHILLQDEDFHGGRLGRCDGEHFDQSSCDPSRNFKPLDCVSYPFAPTIKGGDVTLSIDTERCPLSLSALDEHALAVRELWRDVIASNPLVANWIEQLRLEGYVDYIFKI